jgi:drug/metabolite transporter (DMT)-like permease
MKAGDVVRLVALAAIWGASFMFMRVVSPVLGPVIATDSRMLVAGAALAAYFRVIGFDPQWRRWWRQYVLIGVLNSGLPFLLYSYAALHIAAGLSAVLNATAPMFGALLGVALLGERLTLKRTIGLVLGVVGVALVTRQETGSGFAGLAIGAGLLAASSYAFTGVYLKRWAPQIPARGLAAGTQVAAAAVFLPLVPFAPPYAELTMPVVLSVLALGLICGAVAYLLYFRLIVDIGATGALTVTYLIPLFGVLFGAVFLHEALSLQVLAGAALVVLGTVFVLRS